jgi:hypothetical protein
MPAPSKKARRAWAIAEHEPGKLYSRNRDMLKATNKEMHDFASTPEKGLPVRVRKMNNKVKRMKIR